MVSVLMCTYNRERYLKQAIDSVLSQTYRDFEFIIVDDGSTDDSERIIKTYEDSRIQYFKLERNSFYCYAANYGLKQCTGEYVAFINSDDAWEPDKLEKQIAFMEENKEYGACFTTVTLIDNENRDVTDEYPDMKELFEKQCGTQKEYLYELMKYSNFLCHPSAVVRKTVMDKVGGFNLMFCQLADWDLWIRIVSEFPIHVLNERLIQFRWDKNIKDQISTATVEHMIRHFNEEVLLKKHALDRLSDEMFRSCFGEAFKNKNSASHLELEFEKAFFLAGSLKENPELKVLGIEKLEQVMKMPGAMETLRGHFGMDIFDLYNWNKEHMYITPWLMDGFHQKVHQIQCQEMKIEQKVQEMQEQIKQQLQQIENQRVQIDGQKQEIEKKNCQINEKDQLIATYANSTSWKATEPMRRVMRMFKK